MASWVREWVAVCFVGGLTVMDAAMAQVPSAAVGVVLDASATSRSLGLGQRDQGLGLGHSDVWARGALGAHWDAQAIIAVFTHERQLEAELENAWLQTRTLPAGLQLRVGRFASQVGYLNEQHPHADDFVERPLLYRAFLGGHWFDDGLRLNWTAPTDTFVRVGLEALRGRQLGPQAAAGAGPGAVTASVKIGRDWGLAHSWQMGAAYLHNRRQARALHEMDTHEHAHEHAVLEDFVAGHRHGGLYTGQHGWLLDAVWKWAPQGEAQRRQVRSVVEYARLHGLPEDLDPRAQHEALSWGGVVRFASQWEAGLRTDWLRLAPAAESSGALARVREHALMVAYKPSHRQTLRVQHTTQRGEWGGERVAQDGVQVQYVLSLGAHGAHTY